MRKFKDTLVGKGSALFEALKVSPKAAEKVYKETNARYCSMYSKEDREWFANWSPNV
jgi:hypothetical protein